MDWVKIAEDSLYEFELIIICNINSKIFEGCFSQILLVYSWMLRPIS